MKGEEFTELLVRQENCQHNSRFVFLGSNRVNFGSCKQCGKEIGMDKILNIYFERIDDLIERLADK